MKYFKFDDDAEDIKALRKTVNSYRKQFEHVEDDFPIDMTLGERFVAFMLIINAHAIACMVPDDDEDGEAWKRE